MGNLWNKGTALLIAVVLCGASLCGCSKKTEAEPVYTFNGEEVDADLTTFILRYQEASMDVNYINYYSEMLGYSYWTMEYSDGITSWDYFLDEFGTELEKMLLAEEHADDYDVVLTDDEKAEITEAASQFIEDNDKDVLEAMCADQDIVERYLTLYTLQEKVEAAISEDVDTDVSDEEANQRAVSYIKYVPSTEEETEIESESESELLYVQTEDEIENITENIIENITEGETSPVETEEADKTNASDIEKASESEEKQGNTGETEAEDGAGETEAEDKTGETEAEDKTGETEAEDKTGETEAEQDLTENEGETETEDPAMEEAKIKYRAMAQEELQRIIDTGEDFDSAMDDIDEEEINGVSSDYVTFGADGTSTDGYTTYDMAIVDATDNLEDDTLVDHVVEAYDADEYYILYVDEALDEDSTELKRESIIDERKEEKIDEVYDEWMEDETWETDSASLALLTADRLYNAPEEDEDLDEEIYETESELFETETEYEIIITSQTEFGVTDEGNITALTESE